jgi:hypothetical protein
MSVQPVSSAMMNVNQLIPQVPNNAIIPYNGSSNAGFPLDDSYLGQSNGAGLVLTSQNYSASSLALAYQSKDGDSVTLSTQSIEFQKAMLSVNGSNSPEDWKKIVDYLKDQFASLKAEIIKSFLKSNGQQTGDSTATTGSDQTSATDEIPGLPEYWNAENTSQRIVDFATSFLGAFKGSGEEFLSMIKDAIDKGFSQARDITGDLPDPVAKLVNNTHDLVMKKLDAWAEQQGIKQPDNTQASAAA